MSEERIYSIVLAEEGLHEIVEGIAQNAIFTGTHDQCQAEILMSLLD